MKRNSLIGLILILVLAVSCMWGDGETNYSLDQGGTGGGDDDTGDDDTGDDDDDSGPALVSIEISPSFEGIPVTSTFGYSAKGIYDDGSESELLVFEWSTGDSGVATVDSNGLVTGVAAGQTTITAAIGEISGSADAFVGPDVFLLDAFGGGIGSLDRISGDVVVNILDPATTGGIPNDMAIVDKVVYVVNSDLGSGIGALQTVALDAKDYTIEQLDLPELASPWSIGFSPLGFAYIPGNLSDNLAVYDPVEGLLGTAYLYADSTPTNVAFAAGKAYVADTAFDLDTLTYGIGKVSVIDLSSHLVLKNIETTAINPNSILAAPSGKVYVACPDYEDLTGVIDIIDSETDQIVDSIDMGIAPGPLALAPNGKLFVGEGWAGQFYVIDTADDSVLRGNADPVDACESFWTHDLAVDDDGTLYVVDFVNQTICTFSSEDYASAGDFPVTGVSAQKIVVW